ncbi:MAG: hypothetical protein ACRCUY_00180 [Thermoguttaceae bacterium]
MKMNFIAKLLQNVKIGGGGAIQRKQVVAVYFRLLLLLSFWLSVPVSAF